MNEFVHLRGSNYFRIKIAYSLLYQRPIKISNIRTNSINPGLTEHEISFLKLIEKITNGTKIEISKTGTILNFHPGIITNNYGNEFEYTCDNSRCLTYYLEGLIPISLYGKESLKIILNGVTNEDNDISIDTFKNVTCTLIQKLVIGDKVECDIKKRGVHPLGNGQVKFRCPIITFLNYFDWIDEGKIKRIRGNAFTSRIPGSFCTRMVDACRGVFNNFLPDVWIAVDNVKSKNTEEISQGYGLSLYGETTNGFFFSSDLTYRKDSKELTPEELARNCSLTFLQEIFNCGTIDSHHLPLFLFLMSISTNQAVSKIKVGKISKNLELLLRLLNSLIGVKFKISEFQEDDYDEEIPEEDEENAIDDEEFEVYEEREENQESNEINQQPKYIFSCVGAGVKNVSRIEA